MFLETNFLPQACTAGKTNTSITDEPGSQVN